MLLLELEKNRVVNAKNITSIRLTSLNLSAWFISVVFNDDSRVRIPVPSEYVGRKIYESLIDWLSGHDNGYLNVVDTFGLNNEN